MKPNKRYAIAWALLMLAFLGIASLNFWQHRMVPGIIILVGGWAMCIIQVFDYGALHAYELVMELLNALAEEDKDGNAKGNVQRKCRNCGGEAFTQAAGRYVCACCGDVLEKDHGRDSV